MILLFDDIITHPEEQLRRVSKFLNVSENTKINSDLLIQKANPARIIKIKYMIPIMNFTRRLLIDLRLSFIMLILRRLRIINLIMRLNTEPFNYPVIKDETRGYLRNVFKDDIRKLEILLNRDLSQWE